MKFPNNINPIVEVYSSLKHHTLIKLNKKYDLMYDKEEDIYIVEHKDLIDFLKRPVTIQELNDMIEGKNNGNC